MRIRFVLDNDVLARLKRESQLRDTSLPMTLNHIIREGLALAERRRRGDRPFRVKPRSFGLRPGLNYDNTSRLLAICEGEDAR